MLKNPLSCHSEESVSPSTHGEDEIRFLGADPLRTFHAKLPEDLPDVYRILPGTGKWPPRVALSEPRAR
jgi:hypothetical protein